MYGNQILPGVSVSETYRVVEGSIWQGYPEATWFKTVKVGGEDGVEIPAGTIMKELADGTYTPIATNDIITGTANLPGARLVIVADKSAKKGSTTEVDGETVSEASAVLVGISGIVNKGLLYIGETKFTELEEAQQVNLTTQLEAWHFMLINVTQA